MGGEKALVNVDEKKVKQTSTLKKRGRGNYKKILEPEKMKTRPP